MNTKQSWNKHWGSQRTIVRLKAVNTAYPEVVRLLLGLTGEKSNCLELGCGSGTYAIELLAKGRQCIASDFSKEALELTKLKGKQLYNLEAPIQLVDAYNIPYPDTTFDLVFSDGLIEHLDIDKVLKEQKRVLKPNGWMIAKVPSGSILYKMVYYLLSPVENRPYEVWFSQKEWQKKTIEAGYKNTEISKCGSILAGIAMRIPVMRKFIKYLPNIVRVYFLIKAQK